MQRQAGIEACSGQASEQPRHQCTFGHQGTHGGTDRGTRHFYGCEVERQFLLDVPRRTLHNNLLLCIIVVVCLLSFS